MNEKVEKVTRAIISYKVKHGLHFGSLYDDGMARVAIQAMREPTEAMHDAMKCTASLSSQMQPMKSPHWREQIWNSGIDAALGKSDDE